MLRSFYTIIFCFIIFTSFSQQAYTWDDYGISFSLADDFKETANTGEEFAAVGDGMEMSIIPFADETIDDKDITTYTMSIAASLNLTRIDAINEIQINGFKGGYAEGVSEGVKVFIMGLIDPDTDTNFFVTITFLDNDKLAIEEAINICKSIHKI